MDNNFGGDFVSITDEEGNEFELELLDALIQNGVYYHAFLPVAQEGEDPEEDELEIVILKSLEEDGEEVLSTLDSDEEVEEIYALFMERLFDEEEE